MSGGYAPIFTAPAPGENPRLVKVHDGQGNSHWLCARMPANLLPVLPEIYGLAVTAVRAYDAWTFALMRGFPAHDMGHDEWPRNPMLETMWDEVVAEVQARGRAPQ